MHGPAVQHERPEPGVCERARLLDRVHRGVKGQPERILQVDPTVVEGGLCVYVNNSWCTNTVTVDRHCSPDLEYVTVKCRPIYLPREFTVVMITAVYIPPDANANSAIGPLHSSISSQQSTYPDAVHIIAGDFLITGI